MPSAAAVVEPDPYLAELAGKPHTLQHKRVLTTSGVQLGTRHRVDAERDDVRPWTGGLLATFVQEGLLRR